MFKFKEKANKTYLVLMEDRESKWRGNDLFKAKNLNKLLWEISEVYGEDMLLIKIIAVEEDL